MPGCRTTNTTFILRQLQEKYLAITFTPFNIHTQAFDQVPRDVVWWALRKLGVQEWLVKIVYSQCTVECSNSC